MKVIHQSRLKHLRLTFATGDIFDAPVEAIVNSEQTGGVPASGAQDGRVGWVGMPAPSR